jgi:hypothetical protein
MIGVLLNTLATANSLLRDPTCPWLIEWLQCMQVTHISAIRIGTSCSPASVPIPGMS